MLKNMEVEVSDILMWPNAILSGFTDALGWFCCWLFIKHPEHVVHCSLPKVKPRGNQACLSIRGANPFPSVSVHDSPDGRLGLQE